MDKSQVTIPLRVRFVMVAEWVFHHWLLIWTVLFTIYNLLPILAPILMRVNLDMIAMPIYDVYHLVGHQLANRSFFFFGEQVTYTLEELPVPIVGEFLPDSTALGDFIGNEQLGWKMAWSDRLVSMYGSALITTYIYILLHKRENYKPLARHWMILLVMPLIIDGTTHYISDFDSLIEGFRWDNAWFATLTGNAFPQEFYVGDNRGSFNSILRLITGILFGIGLMAWALPALNIYFERNANILRERLDKWWARQLVESTPETNASASSSD